jgi:hypothetical protein
MAFAKWGIVFASAFCLAFIIIVTFSQAPFKQPVPAMIFSYQTKSIALYWYVVGALGVGLAIGLMVALYSYIDLKTTLFKKNKTIRELEEKLAICNRNEKEPLAGLPQDSHLPVEKIVEKIEDADL